eukprot:scaffold104923_cov90-Phaeocystis_antarctica.AAC.3
MHAAEGTQHALAAIFLRHLVEFLELLGEIQQFSVSRVVLCSTRMATSPLSHLALMTASNSKRLSQFVNCGSREWTMAFAVS